MNIIDIIDKKRLKLELTREELEFAFNSYLEKKIPDYQMSALLMAIAINGMTDEEAINLTDIFIKSGETIDLSDVDGVVVDKHSTGGVGDKTTFIIAPVLASCGVKICKMSGRGLGPTGGTIDKMESIKGIKTELTEEEMKKALKEVGMVVCGQTKDLAPMDKVIYSLRDVTATVSSIPLIAASIMSKKIAAGADKIYIDLKVGSGALIKTVPEAECLMELFMTIGEHYKKQVEVELSNMNRPLGSSVGNGLEILEVIDILQGKEKNNLTRLSTKIIIQMLMMAKGITKEEASKEAAEAFSSLKAYDKFLEFVKYQGGDLNQIAVSSKKRIVKAPKDGYIKNIDASKVGNLVKNMGGGRITKDDEIDLGVGIYFFKYSGQEIKEGEELCTLFLGEKDVKDEDVLACYEIITEKELEELRKERAKENGEEVAEDEEVEVEEDQVEDAEIEEADEVEDTEEEVTEEEIDESEEEPVEEPIEEEVEEEEEEPTETKEEQEPLEESEEKTEEQPEEENSKEEEQPVEEQEPEEEDSDYISPEQILLEKKDKEEEIVEEEKEVKEENKGNVILEEVSKTTAMPLNDAPVIPVTNTTKDAEEQEETKEVKTEEKPEEEKEELKIEIPGIN